MSLPQDWNLQDSRGSLYCPSESDATGGVKYQSRGLICESSNSVEETNTDRRPSSPCPPVSLTEYTGQSGSLFSIHSAPPVASTDHGDYQNTEDLLGFGCAGTGPGTGTTAIDDISTRRPSTLHIDSNQRKLHSSLLERQISEIEEEDNENLLTLSSVTARPLIAKSREIRTNRINTKYHGVNRDRKLMAKVKEVPSSASSTVTVEPPDGGYGWFIVFGAFSVQFWVAGLVKSYGVLYVEIMETFPSSSASVASWIPAVLSALCLALAPLSSALCQRFSCRTVVFAGGICCALGLALSYFATSLIHLLFTFGILTGIGGGLSTTPGIVIVSQYFEKHRALANGICVSGTAAGSFVLPILIKHLVENFGFHGTILILGVCMLHVCFSATLYKPLDGKEEEMVEEFESVANKDNLLTNSTYLESTGPMDEKFIEQLFSTESRAHISDFYKIDKFLSPSGNTLNQQTETDDEVKDIVNDATFPTKPIMKSVRSSGILHSVEDLTTDSTWVYRRSESTRGSRRRRNVFANDEIISKIQAHLEKPLSPPIATTKGLSKSMEIPTPISKFDANRDRKHSVDDTIAEDDDEDPRKTCCERIEQYLDISLLKDPTFILMCLSVTLMSVGCPYMLYYLPAHVISIGYNKSEAGYLVATSAALDLIGRLGLGWLTDLQIFDRKKAYVLCIIGAGIVVLIIPSTNFHYVITFCAAFYGLCLGCWYVMMPVLLADIFGTEKISSSYGLVRLFQSVGAISVPPLAGLLRDLSGSYAICFYCMGSCMLMGAIPLFMWVILKNTGYIAGGLDEVDIENENDTTIKT